MGSADFQLPPRSASSVGHLWNGRYFYGPVENTRRPFPSPRPDLDIALGNRKKVLARCRLLVRSIECRWYAALNVDDFIDVSAVAVESGVGIVYSTNSGLDMSAGANIFFPRRGD